MESVYCKECHIMLEDNEIVIMDELNALSHKHCYDWSYGNIKDMDTFYIIKSKYDYYDVVDYTID